MYGFFSGLSLSLHSNTLILCYPTPSRSLSSSQKNVPRDTGHLTVVLSGLSLMFSPLFPTAPVFVTILGQAVSNIPSTRKRNALVIPVQTLRY